MDQGQSGEIQGMKLRTSLHLSVVVIETGAFGSPSTKVANFTYFTIYIYIYIYIYIII